MEQSKFTGFLTSSVLTRFSSTMVASQHWQWQRWVFIFGTRHIHLLSRMLLATSLVHMHHQHTSTCTHTHMYIVLSLWIATNAYMLLSVTLAIRLPHPTFTSTSFTFCYPLSHFWLLSNRVQQIAQPLHCAVNILLIHNVQDVLTSQEFAVCPEDQRLKQVHVLFSGLFPLHAHSHPHTHSPRHKAVYQAAAVALCAIGS